MREMTSALFLFLVLTSAGCERKVNDAVTPVRQEQDSISLSNALATDEPIAARRELEAWLRFFPGEINRVFPESVTTPLGLVAQKYYEAPAESQESWRELLFYLVDQGADVNILLPLGSQRRGLVHVAVERGDRVLIEQLIERLGLAQPPLRLSCETIQGRREQRRPSQGPATQQRAVNLNFQEADRGWTPLHYAVGAAAVDPELIEYLLLKGANPDLADSSLNLVSPYQLVENDAVLGPIFRKYSGAQIRYDSRLNSFINDEMETSPEQRKKLLDLAKEYRTFVENEGFQTVQDINRIVDICKTGERLNVLGYATLYLIPSFTVAAQGATRNQAITSWINDYGANFCASEPLKIKTGEGLEFRESTLKTLVKEALITSDQETASPVNGNLRRLRIQNSGLWCDIIRPHAIERGCWTAEDETLSQVNQCQPL